MKKGRLCRRIAMLFVCAAMLAGAAAYTSIHVGEEEIYIKAVTSRGVLASKKPEQLYKSVKNIVSAESIHTEKDKVDAIIEKQRKEERRRREEQAKPLKERYTGKLVAFTFDDGPGRYTNKLLDGLKERDAHATFMVLGSCAVNNQEVLQRMTQEGHQIGCHSWSHTDFTKLKPDEIEKEIKDTISVIQDAGYKERCVVRPPYGAYNDEVKKEASAPLILWNVDTEDWRHKGDVKTVYNNILRDAHDGAVILLHDIYESSVDAALKAMDTLKKEGYQFVTVDELFLIRDIPLEDGTIYYSAKAGS